MRLSRSAIVGIVIGALVAAVLGLGGAAVAGRDGDRLAACAAKKDGALRLMTGKGCRQGERATSWDKQGDPGLPGAPGAPGAAGVSGYEIVSEIVSETGAVGAAFFGGHELTCPAGKRAVCVTAR